MSKTFPIHTKTSCPLKWNWSTINLTAGTTQSCHRTAFSLLSKKNFKDFHNTPLKILDRQKMLQGQWPDESCKYCKSIEDKGGFSDRMRHINIPYDIPKEIKDNNTEVYVSPTIVEVYFNNTCNLGCLYCDPSLSSIIEQENNKFGSFQVKGVTLQNSTNYYSDLIDSFWEWFDVKFTEIRRLIILGGEPFYQKEFDLLLEKIESNPNKDCVLAVVTNLMINENLLRKYIQKFKKLLAAKKIKQIDITCSIDCWGAEQEYVRWGLNLQQWEKNFEILLNTKWIKLNINQTISSLTLKSMPILLDKLTQWRKIRNVGHFFSAVDPEPTYMKANIFGSQEFTKDVEQILKLMPQDTYENQTAYQYMHGILNDIITSKLSIDDIDKLITYLTEKDRRRNTVWQDTFPWLKKYVV